MQYKCLQLQIKGGINAANIELDIEIVVSNCDYRWHINHIGICGLRPLQLKGEFTHAINEVHIVTIAGNGHLHER